MIRFLKCKKNLANARRSLREINLRKKAENLEAESLEAESLEAESLGVNLIFF
jgi:cell shape-determining protein MreC